MLKARVITQNNLPRLVINGDAVVPHLFFLRAEKEELRRLNREQIHSFAAQGMHLYTTIVNLPFIPTNGQRDLSAALDTLRFIIDCDPEAKILPRIGLSPVGPRIGDYQGLTPMNCAVEYCTTYPEDQMQWHIERAADHTSMVSNNSTAISMASDRWFNTACEALSELHSALKADPVYDDHLLGYHIGCGETGEWFYYGLRERGLDFSPANKSRYQEYLRHKYGDIRTLEQAWHIALGSYLNFEQIAIPDDLPYADREKEAQRTLFIESADARYRDYYDYSSDLMADRMADMARFARTLVGENKLLVFFYGYYFEVYDALTGHFRLQKLLDNPDIDAFTSPISYADRNHGGIGALMSPADSVTAHGKLWIVEDDIRTCNVVHQTAAQSEWDWIPKVNSLENLIEVQTREAGHMLAHNMGCWYMDLLGYGWHHHPMIWAHIGRIAELYRQTMPTLSPLRPDVAVVTDEKAMSMATHAQAVGLNLLHHMRTAFYRAGVKFGLYTSQDYESGIADSASVVFYLNPFDISDERAEKLAQRLSQNHATLVLMHGLGRTSEKAARLLSGMNIRTLTDGMASLICKALSGALTKDVQLLPAEPNIQRANPASYVEMDGNAQPLAVYESGALAGKIAMARCHHDGFSSVFVGPMALSSAGLRELCRLCGAPIYCESDDSFVAGNGIYMIHTGLQEGIRTLTLPKPATLLSWGEGTRRNSVRFETDGRSTATYLWLDAALFPHVR